MGNMIKKFNQSNESKKFNLRASNDLTLNITPESVPTLVPSHILKEFMKDDDDPYYKIQAIEFPVIANGYNYTEKFFRSFVAKLNRSYIPGSKAGHSNAWGSRPPTDLMLVGGRIDSIGGGAGTVYLKNYIPKKGESGDNEFFIKENMANSLDYSLVSYTKDERQDNPDGSVTWNVVESLFGERNDAVQYGTGAMPQKTNQEETLSEGSEKNNQKGVKKVEKSELLDSLKVLKENAAVSLPEIAKHLELSAMLVTNEHLNAVDELAKIKKLCGTVEPYTMLEQVLFEKKQNAERMRGVSLSEIAGPATFTDSGKQNELRQYAEIFFKDDEITEEKKNAFKEDPIAKRIASDRADWSSSVNVIGTIEGKENTLKIGGSIKI